MLGPVGKYIAGAGATMWMYGHWCDMPEEEKDRVKKAIYNVGPLVAGGIVVYFLERQYQKNAARRGY